MTVLLCNSVKVALTNSMIQRAERMAIEEVVRNIIVPNVIIVWSTSILASFLASFFLDFFGKFETSSFLSEL